MKVNIKHVTSLNMKKNNITYRNWNAISSTEGNIIFPETIEEIKHVYPIVGKFEGISCNRCNKEFVLKTECCSETYTDKVFFDKNLYLIQYDMIKLGSGTFNFLKCGNDPDSMHLIMEGVVGEKDSRKVNAYLFIYEANPVLEPTMFLYKSFQSNLISTICGEERDIYRENFPQKFNRNVNILNFLSPILYFAKKLKNNPLKLALSHFRKLENYLWKCIIINNSNIIKGIRGEEFSGLGLFKHTGKNSKELSHYIGDIRNYCFTYFLDYKNFRTAVKNYFFYKYSEFYSDLFMKSAINFLITNDDYYVKKIIDDFEEMCVPSDENIFYKGKFYIPKNIYTFIEFFKEYRDIFIKVFLDTVIELEPIRAGFIYFTNSELEEERENIFEKTNIYKPGIYNFSIPFILNNSFPNKFEYFIEDIKNSLENRKENLFEMVRNFALKINLEKDSLGNLILKNENMKTENNILEENVKTYFSEYYEKCLKKDLKKMPVIFGETDEESFFKFCSNRLLLENMIEYSYKSLKNIFSSLSEDYERERCTITKKLFNNLLKPFDNNLNEELSEENIKTYFPTFDIKYDGIFDMKEFKNSMFLVNDIDSSFLDFFLNYPYTMTVEEKSFKTFLEKYKNIIENLNPFKKYLIRLVNDFQ